MKNVAPNAFNNAKKQLIIVILAQPRQITGISLIVVMQLFYKSYYNRLKPYNHYAL